MRSFLFMASVAFIAYGLWAHDWTVIIASVGLTVTWPLIAADVKRHHERQLLESLWDDGDLSDSA